MNARIQRGMRRTLFIRNRVRILALASATLALQVAWSPAAANTGEAAEALPARSFELTDPDRIAAGKKRFNKTCAGYCHGYEGVGGRAPDFKGRKDLPDEEAFKTIFHGRRGADIMPPWGQAFSSDQIWELVAYIKFLGNQ